MTEGEKTRLVAWSNELRNVHARLRKALSITQEALSVGVPAQELGRDLLLYCHGFCTALAAHHEGEDRELFPAIAAKHPELQEVLQKLTQDHSMIAYLITGLKAAIDAEAPQDELSRHLEGIAAIMESHFRYEERQLLAVLETLSLDEDPGRVLGPF